MHLTIFLGTNLDREEWLTMEDSKRKELVGRAQAVIEKLDAGRIMNTSAFALTISYVIDETRLGILLRGLTVIPEGVCVEDNNADGGQPFRGAVA